MKKINFDNLKVNDIVVLNVQGTIMCGIITEKEINNAGKLVRVKIGYEKPRIIYVEDFLADKMGHPAYNPETIIRVAGNVTKDIEKID